MKVRVKLLIILCVFIKRFDAQGLDDDGNEVIDQVEHYDSWNFDIPNQVQEEVKSTKTVNDQITSNTLDLGENEKIHNNISSSNSSSNQASTEKSVENLSESEILEIKNSVNLDVRNEVQNLNNTTEVPSIVLDSAEIVEESLKSNNTTVVPPVSLENSTTSKPPETVVIPAMIKQNLSTPETAVPSETTTEVPFTTTTPKLQSSFREVIIHIDPATLAPTTFKKKHQNPNIPDNCSEFKTLPIQPIQQASSFIKKCCPIGQNYQYDSAGNRFCGNETIKFDVQAIKAKFFEHCIEDEEVNIDLKISVENQCKRGYVYNQLYNDTLYVIQNGSLLRVDSNFQSFDIYTLYCLDMDSQEGVLTAIACGGDDVIILVEKGQALIFAICMLISVPCLIITACLYLIVPELNDLHGKSLACHSFCLAIGFGLLAFSQFREGDFIEGYIIQWCIISCFFWLTNMWIDICLHAWYYLPKGLMNQDDKRLLMYYAIIAFGIPLIFVLLSYKNGYNGLPSYYISGTTEIGRSCQMFFIPPISFSLCVNIVLYILSYFGFRRINKLKIKSFLSLNLRKGSSTLTKQNLRHMKKVETIEKSTFYLTVIMTVNWIFEILSFYIETPLLIFDVLNSLQGLTIFLIFVCLPRPLRLIKRWWKHRGSYEVPRNNSNRDGQTNSINMNNNAATSITEMESLKNNPQQ